MSSIKLESNASGTGVFTIASPNSNTNRTLTLPDNTGTVVSTASTPTFSGAVTAPGFIPNSSTVVTDGMYLPTTNTLAWSTNTTERMRITSSGNVGIGITPSTNPKLHIKQSSNTTDGGLIITASDESGSAGIARLTDGGMTFRNAGAEYARITSGGNFLIGNTDGTLLLTIGSSKLAGGNQQNAITSGTTGTFSASNSSGGTCAIAADFISSAGTAVFSLDSGTTNGYYFRTYDSGYDYRFRIAKSGSATNSTGSYGTISDARTKTVVGSASSQWDDIKQLNFIKYKLNKQIELEQSEENKDGYVAPVMLGLVAQEVEQICPGLIEESADPEFDQVKVIKTSILYMKAVKALQEAQLRIETLEAQNAAFEARLAALEAK